MSSSRSQPNRPGVVRGLTLGGEIRKLATLSLPVVLTQIGFMLFGVVDLMMVGRVGTDEIAAGQLGNLWVFGMMLFGLGLVHGIDPIVSQAHGAGDAARLGRALQRGLVLALLASVPVSILLLLTEEALVLLNQDPTLAAMAEEYALVQIPSVPCFLAFTALRQYLQGREIVLPALVIVGIANAVNVFANWSLIFGHAGMPALGLVGSGIATSITRGSMILLLVLWIVKARLHEGAWIAWSRDAFRLGGLAEPVRTGLPVAMQMGLEVWAFQITTLLAGFIGTLELAAHSVVLNMASLTFMVPLGISFGASTRVGNLIGAGVPREAQRASWVALALGAAAMAVPAIGFLVFSEELPRFYTQDAAVVAAATLVLPAAAAFQVFDGVQVVGMGILRGMGRSLPATLFNLVGYYVLALPLAYWLAFHTDGTGLIGLWWGLALGLAFVALSLVLWIGAFGPAQLGPMTRGSQMSRDAAGKGPSEASS